MTSTWSTDRLKKASWTIPIEIELPVKTNFEISGKSVKSSTTVPIHAVNFPWWKRALSGVWRSIIRRPINIFATLLIKSIASIVLNKLIAIKSFNYFLFPLYLDRLRSNQGPSTNPICDWLVAVDEVYCRYLLPVAFLIKNYIN